MASIREKSEKKLSSKYCKRVRTVFKTELNAKNVSAILSLAVPIIHYNFRIIKWTIAQIRKLDRQTRKIFTIPGAPYHKSNIDRLYIPR